MTVIAEPLSCLLPDLPSPLGKQVGYPSPDGQSIYLSVSDAALLIGYIGGLHSWIVAASGCIEAR